MNKYLPYFIIAKNKVDSVLNGEITLSSAIPSEFKFVLEKYVNEDEKCDLHTQLKNGELIDLSDFSSKVLVLYQCKPDERLKTFGDVAIVIKNPELFFFRLNKANNIKYPNLKYLYAEDIYYDDKLYENNIKNEIFNPFIKRKTENWKQESIIVSRVKPSVIVENLDLKDDILLIPEGIRDIAEAINLNDCFDAFIVNEPQEKFPLITNIEISVSGNIQDIVPEKEHIDKLHNILGNEWQPITRLITSPDGKREVPCLSFISDTEEIQFLVNTILLKIFKDDCFAIEPHISSAIEFYENILKFIEIEYDTAFSTPYITIVADIGEVSEKYKDNQELDIKRSFFKKGLIYSFRLCINSLITNGKFGIPHSTGRHWMLQEQIFVPEKTLWYNSEKIIAFYNKATDEIREQMESFVGKDVPELLLNTVI